MHIRYLVSSRKAVAHCTYIIQYKVSHPLSGKLSLVCYWQKASGGGVCVFKCEHLNRHCFIKTELTPNCSAPDPPVHHDTRLQTGAVSQAPGPRACWPVWLWWKGVQCRVAWCIQYFVAIQGCKEQLSDVDHRVI